MHVDVGEAGTPTHRDEDNYWHTLRLSQEQEDEIIKENFVFKADQHHSRLAALFREKRDLENRMQSVHQAIASEESGMEDLTFKFNEAKEVRLEQRLLKRQKMQAWFNAHRRGEDPDNAAIAAAALAAPKPPPPQSGDTVNGAASVSLGGNGHQPAIDMPRAPSNGATVTVIVDSSNHCLGTVERMSVSGNLAVLLKTEAKRPVQLRPGIHFTAYDVKKLHDNKDQWVGAMMQATGQVRHPQQQCTRCTELNGPFSICVVFEGSSGCANCYWERKPCRFEPPPGEERPPSASQRPNGPVQNGRNDGQSNGTATPVSLSRPASRDKSVGQGSTATEDMTEEDRTPITKSSLLFQHDGKVYTHPPCMEGVPLDRIDPGHPYWDPEWPEIAPAIETTLQTWRDKYDVALRNPQNSGKFQLGRQVNRGETILAFLRDASFSPYQLVSKKYMSPKLASYDTVFRLADTLGSLGELPSLDVAPLEWLRHRLHEIIVQHETDPDKDGKFNLAKTIHDFYHDSKLVDLRHANGKKSIGRPSGMKMTPKESPSGGKTTPNPKKRKLFINEEFPTPPPHPLASMPTPTPVQGHMQTQAQMQTQFQTRIYPSNPAPVPQGDTDRSAPSTPNMISRGLQRPKTKGNGKPKDPDLAYEGYTDVDDYSRDSVGRQDWALNRIKTRLNQAGTAVTQYWHWIGDDDERLFEHQVLAEGDSFSWGIYANPINFHLELDHMLAVKWAAGTTKVIVVCKENSVTYEGRSRGDVLAEFKRERTTRRFLVFCRKMGIELIKVEREFIEEAWDEYESDDVPAMAEAL
ncbi:hypothetical protein C8034_v003312 [Colletotrichum sidae]|nr:hypothetical protein C8034_v003312 [Colletotrichum sidae]